VTRRGTVGLLGAFGLGVVLLAAVARAGAEPPPGNAERGRATFTAKTCARCHVPRGRAGIGPALETLRRSQGVFELAGRLWNHAPAMFTVLSQEGLPWPRIGLGEMADLMAYLEADVMLDPTPDLFKGQLALIRKGCLKCHRLRGEGARIAPDLATQHASYESAVAWASRMWEHTPAMAAKAMEVGVLYPRFTEDEMLNLVGFLRSSSR